MASTSLISFLIVVAALVIVDIFCTDLNARGNQNVEPSNNAKSTTSTEWPALNRRNQRLRTSTEPSNNAKSTTTEWPALNQRNQRLRTSTQNPKKWIQQNNIWIRNEQASVVDNNRQQTSTKPPLKRGDTYTVIKPQIPTPLGPKSPQSNSPSVGPIQETNTKDEVIVNNSDVTDDELREFSENILKKDSNNAMKFVTLNLQGMTSSRSSNDEAPLPLLEIKKEAYNIPSIEKLVLLHNNYFLEASQNEVYTGQERIEENNLLDTILATPVMQFARSFLVQKGKIGKDPKEFRDLLRLIWFNMYSRGQGRIGSSGFEHVFVAEIKNSQVSGLHNWIYFKEEEQAKRANYLGYLKKIDLGEKGAILKYHFTFHDIDKPVGSMFIGTSPELEIALYSTCFILRADKICPLKMNGNRFIIRTYTYKYRGKNMIGSAFPEI
ncbi:unnamed protein product [Ceutorhynchus assimilis]|uniref:EndoU domain-containing protein n=1 Tax=Ceutorhynchus assimilis TaxID=467358 RepID=A0A9N9MGI8_9CUCU|nr:unnamed protein product [Ceutorhynchus assimilis]